MLDTDTLTHILSVLQAKGTEYWWTGPVDEFVPPAQREGMDAAQLAATWRKGTDTMDVWFDSGTSWSMLDALYLGAGSRSGSGRTFGADVCLEGSDQHRGWFQSQLLTAVGAALGEERMRGAPYSALITHGMVLDESGRKMSKSLGNVVSPMKIINGGEVRAPVVLVPWDGGNKRFDRTRRRSLRMARRCSVCGRLRWSSPKTCTLALRCSRSARRRCGRYATLPASFSGCSKTSLVRTRWSAKTCAWYVRMRPLLTCSLTL